MQYCVCLFHSVTPGLRLRVCGLYMYIIYVDTGMQGIKPEKYFRKTNSFGIECLDIDANS